MTTARLALIPRDGLFCKDGRDWHTSSSGRGHGLDWPWPSTVLGALRTASGRTQEALTGRRFAKPDWRAHAAAISLGSTLVLRRSFEPRSATSPAWKQGNRVWPAPADARQFQDSVHLVVLEPVPPSLPTLGRDDNPAREALWVPSVPNKAKPLPLSRWWSDARFTAWLAGDAVSAMAPDDTFNPQRRNQAHVQIRPDVLTAVDGALYSHDIVETLERRAEWALGVEVVLPGSAIPSIASLGSDGRLAPIESLDAEIFGPPPRLVQAFRGGPRGLRLFVVAPACFTEGWLPDGFTARGLEFRGRLPCLDAELVLRAAFVPRPAYVSGWDIAARRPKPTSALVPPGAVYFVERVDQRPFGEAEARTLWLAAVGQRTGQGYGRVVPGIWNPTRTQP